MSLNYILFASAATNRTVCHVKSVNHSCMSLQIMIRDEHSITEITLVLKTTIVESVVVQHFKGFWALIGTKGTLVKIICMNIHVKR